MKHFLVLSLFFTTTFVLTCNADDDDYSADDLVGTWELIDRQDTDTEIDFNGVVITTNSVGVLVFNRQ